MIIPKIGFYKHYKHDPSKGVQDHVYEVVGISRDTENKRFSVLYRPLYTNDWFLPANYQSRPLDMFNENLLLKGVLKPCFEFITDPGLIERLKIVASKMY